MEGTIGEIRMFAGNFSPKNWAFCNGAVMPIATNTALFSILGTTYGGDGRVTFGLPDLQGRVPVGTGQGPGLPSYQLGERAGTETVQLQAANIPPHVHTFSATVAPACKSGAGNADTPVGNISAGSATEENFGVLPGDGAMAPISIAGNTGPAGGNQAVNNMQPYLGMNYIICLYGIYPSRN